MKYLMIALISVFISLVCVPSATADNSREWTVGDLISVGLVCMMGVCISFEGSMRFLVQRALVHYKDHAGRASVVLGVGNADQDSLGWVLATGKFVSEKKSEETSI